MASTSLSVLMPVALFAIVGSFTPGPNTMIAASIGAQSGWRAAWPHAFGVAVGFCSMLVLAAGGIVGALWFLPGMDIALRLVGAAYMCWCAWGLAFGGTDGSSAKGPARFSFIRSIGFQYLNPKAWMLAMAATSMYAPGATGLLAVAALAICAFAAISSIVCWSAVGDRLGRWLTTRRRRLAFNYCAGGALAGTAVWMLVAG